MNNPDDPVKLTWEEIKDLVTRLIERLKGLNAVQNFHARLASEFSTVFASFCDRRMIIRPPLLRNRAMVVP